MAFHISIASGFWPRAHLPVLEILAKLNRIDTVAKSCQIKQWLWRCL